MLRRIVLGSSVTLTRCLIGSLLAGYGMASRKSRNRMHTFAFAVILALTVYVIRDLEFFVFPD